MDLYNWYLLFNKEEFLSTELVSRTLSLDLENIGLKEILITLGNELSITYEGTFLPVRFKDENPYVFESKAVYEDENSNIWLGVLK